jgi:hypothetical protein
MNRIPRVCRLWLLPAFATVLLVTCRPVVRPLPQPKAVQTLTVLYAGSIDWTRLPEIATLLKTEKPALSIIDGEFLSQGPVTYLFQGRAECEALAHSGVDAVRMTPGFLCLGGKAAWYLADSVLPPVFLLSSDVWDTARQSQFGSAFLRKTIATRTGSLRIGLIGLAGDNRNLLWDQHGIAKLSPDSATRHLVPIMKMTSELLGVAANPADSNAPCPGVDFVIGSADAPLPTSSTTLNRLELDLDAQNRVIGTRVLPLALTRVKPDSAVQEIVRKYQKQAESLLTHRINVATAELDTKNLAKLALKTAASRLRAEGALFGNSLVLKPLGIGEITLARLFDITGTENRLVRTAIEGQEFEQVLTKGEPGVEWRSILKNQRIMLRRQYDIVTTLDYVETHPQLLSRRHDFLPTSLAEIYAFALRDRGKAKPDTTE